jgi:hypothetical protein
MLACGKSANPIPGHPRRILAGGVTACVGQPRFRDRRAESTPIDTGITKRCHDLIVMLQQP